MTINRLQLHWVRHTLGGLLSEPTEQLIAQAEERLTKLGYGVGYGVIRSPALISGADRTEKETDSND